SLLRQGSGRSVDDRGRSTVSVHARPGPRGFQDRSSLVRRATGGHNGLMPALPEADSLVEFLRPRLTGDFVTRADIADLSLLKTVAPDLEALAGLAITEVGRAGRMRVIGFAGLGRVCRLARMGARDR